MQPFEATIEVRFGLVGSHFQLNDAFLCHWGLKPIHTVNNNDYPLSASDVTVAMVLKEAGYWTGMVRFAMTRSSAEQISSRNDIHPKNPYIRKRPLIEQWQHTLNTVHPRHISMTVPSHSA